MSDKSSVCIICNEGETSNNKLVNNVDLLKELLASCKEHMSLGQIGIKLQLACYHSKCRKPVMNKTMIERLRVKLARSNSPCFVKGPGRPSSSGDSAQMKRT